MSKKDRKKHDFLPVELDKVWLTVGRLRWRLLSDRLRRILIDGTENVARIRNEIAKSAKVSCMPPVEVRAELWIGENGVIDGLTTPIVLKDEAWMGVQLPAQTALYTNESHVRALLVHELAHCFYYITEIVNRGDRGLPLSLCDEFSDPYSDADDRAKLVNPFDWFCKQDAEAFMYHSDHRLNEIDKDLPELRGELRVVSPRLDFNVTARVCIEEGIVAHIRRLREAAS